MSGYISDVDLGNTFKGNVLPLNVSMLTINTTAPKIYTFQQDVQGLSVDTVAHLFMKDKVRSDTLNVLGSHSAVSKILEELTGARSGVFNTNVKLVTLESLRTVISSNMGEAGASANNHTVMALCGFFASILSRLGIVSDTGSIKLLDPRKSFLITETELETEVKKSAIKNSLRLFDVEKIPNSGPIGIAVIVKQITGQAHAMKNSLIGLDHKVDHLQTVLILIKSFMVKDFTSYSKDEQSFFENGLLMELSSNYSLVNMAKRQVLTRPRSPYSFWGVALESISSALKSSSEYTTMSFDSFREYFSINVINDLEGRKKSIVVSKNTHESSPLECFYKIDDDQSKVDTFWRLIEQKHVLRYVQSFYDAAARIGMKDVHNLLADNHRRFVTANDAPSVINLNVTNEELFLLSVANGATMEVSIPDDATEDNTLVLSIVTDNSGLREIIPGFMGMFKTTDSRLSLLVVGKDYSGGQSITNSDAIVGDVAGSAFTGLRELMNPRLDGNGKVKLAGHNYNVTIDMPMSDFFVCPSLGNIKLTKPLLGNQIITLLINAFNEQLDYMKTARNNKEINTYKIPNSIAMLDLLKPLVKNGDIDALYHAAAGQIWNQLRNEKLSAGSIRSMISDERTIAEIRVKLAMMMLNKLEFISNADASQKMYKIFKDAGVFEHNLLS